MRRVGRTSVALSAMTLLFLSACGSGGDTGGGGDAAAGDPESLTIWTYFTSPGQLDALEAQNALWAQEHPDIAIQHEQIPFEQLPSRLLATATTQDGPDVILDNVVVDFPTLAGSGVLADMTDYWDGYEDSGLFPDAAIWSYEDSMFNILSYTNLLGLYYNADALAAVGIDPPTTMEEFDAALEAVRADGRYTPLAQSGVPTVEGAWMVFPQLLGEGVDYCSISQDATEPVFDRLQGWAESGTTPRETATWDQADAWQAFMSGQYAFGINGNWNLADVESASFAVGTTQFPAGSQGSHVFPGGEGIGIGAFSEHKDLAWEYVQTAWLSQEAGLANFEASGQIPTRSDLADDPAVTGNELLAPFVEAAASTGSWPVNEQTAAMQAAFGEGISAVLSGQTPAAEAAATTVESIDASKDEGGGGC